ncbi:hypothetical protein Bsp3421_000184 (plasmid) [Burkholderia sp. FERM BP-3421]|uniref:hypothetical protein n=1 Tax=Burkholderia sp. FERM BP-3421 TaxID=1494466 RepID=UPI0023619F2B|nr:hypothetical protein [Burkholderia sp. FERM BP-3421]WDD90352.1 hypothetical protein Bsp3421_000184 [Burkholderia sp. FERM BP-3421]
MGIDLAIEDVPDAPTLLKFRRPLLDPQTVRRNRHFAVRTKVDDEGRYFSRCYDHGIFKIVKQSIYIHRPGNVSTDEK